MDDWERNRGSPRAVRARVWRLLRNLAVPLAFSIVYPLVIYYGLRALGINAFTALILGAVPIVGYQLYQLLRKRQLDVPAGCVLAVLAFSIGMAFITGEERFMLAKAGFFTAVIAGGFLVTLFLNKPVAYTIAAYLLKRMEVPEAHLDFLWNSEPGYRRVWRISTLVWGLGILFNAAIILAMAYLLPVDIVPVLNTIVNFMVFVVLQLVTQYYYRKKGIWKLVFQKGKHGGYINQKT
jgi:hypothetical protein